MSAFLIKTELPLVVDASGLINLIASGIDKVLLSGIEHPVIVSTNVVIELERGRRLGHRDADRADELIDLGLIKVMEVTGSCESMYQSLIVGSAAETLDDGEAATLALALELDGVALIDEQKALRIADERFPELEIICTAEVLMHPSIFDLIGSEAQISAIYQSLKFARMRVPSHMLEKIASMLGSERIVACPSIPLYIRRQYGVRANESTS